ncbi:MULTISPECIES: SH3 domain-containing protein [unclassified Burkholderia]|uniref:SH3 domain-containing protein n=1 Tax=unclassified Burkholderia TaxID=2613784 RepID=UPI000F55FC1A|nr:MULTISPECIES: SH3 domain-containing protein [unclassified Burkholderia]RQR35915.1 peptide-binding protein [Burkholderia sp. Bp9142]RQR52358.1 peptide-binding protein [Burkholderia sp. Bp9140]
MSNTIIRSLCVVLFGIAAVPGLAGAQSSAYTNSAAELYAGPAPDYPVVAQLPPGTAVDVFGCLSDYAWCDVALPGVRGWIDAEQLDYPYQGSYVPLLEYGAIIGVPITGFAIGAYWDRYYRHRPWYHDRDRWERRVEPRVGPGGMPPAYGRPQPGGPIQRAPGGAPPPAQHDARPSATRGGWNGPNRMPAPQAAPAPAPMPGAGGNVRPPAAVERPAPAQGGAVTRMMPPQANPGGGGYGSRPQGGGNNGGGHGGGGGGGGGDDRRHDEFRR